ncbi:T9SS type A sorting domain-containing protein [Flavobacterium silvisoli]|uniref:T9SS type A sorting domain-containing protein n=1 Tax=Flavobacterium silvisoli TaxID=2529433 RepID=A0A4V2L5M9_9FLAO|nr:T9SS type A sorting domain-containing protein [Flavobacterium silvisoli]TBX71321.1 T9SS type A sorting domain-containing protein [Flavobacterium silvisoli]
MKKLQFILILTLLTSAVKVFSQPGVIDSSYATNGSVLTTYNPGLFIPVSSVIQQNGYVVMMGGYGVPASGVAQIGLSRHKDDGTIDTSFGTNGFISINVNNKTYGHSLILQQDGKIVIAGYIENSPTSISLLVVRLTTDGNLDPMFGNNGIAIFNNNMNAFSVKVQLDDKIVVGGNCGNEFAIARLNTDGSLDMDFGFNGLATTTITTSANQSQINAVSIQNDGKIVAAGQANINSINICFCLVRYDSNGNIDTDFGINGKVLTNLNPYSVEIISGMVIQQDGKIVVTGHADQSTVIARYDNTGVLDTLFGTDGISTITYGNSSLSLSLLIQPDNKIVIVGNSPLPNDKFLIARYTDSGILDVTFNTSGYNLGSFGNNNNRFNSILLQSDGKLLATGFTQIGNDVYTVIARFNSGLDLNNDEFVVNKNIRVYPNPTKGIISFNNSKFGYESVTVFNYLGQQVLIPIVCFQSENTIDLSNLSNGIYFLQFTRDKEMTIKKIIKD